MGPPSDPAARHRRQPMPNFVRDALERSRLMDAYRARPLEQQRDYIWWISSAKRRTTQERRLAKMLNELNRGDVYMNRTFRKKKETP